MIIREFNEKDQEKLETFLSRMNFLKLFYYAGLGKERIVKHNLNLIKNITKKKENKVAILEENEKIKGIIAFEFLLFDSDIYGLRMGKISFLLAETKDAYTLLIGFLNDYLVKQGINHISINVDSLNIDALHAIEESKFKIMTTFINFSLDLKKHEISDTRNNGFYIREAKKSDIPNLEKLSEASFEQITRFYFDKKLPKEKTRKLYRLWIRNSCSGLAEKVFVCEEKNKIMGFVTCEVKDHKKDLAIKIGVIGLIAVSREERKKGLGTFLLNTALIWFKNKVDYVQIGTESTNYSALNAYRKVGFKIVSSEKVFHLSV